MKKVLMFFLIFSFVFSFNSLALSRDNSPETVSGAAVVADIFVLRPLGFVGFILGTGAFVISLPVTIPFNSSHEVAKVLVFEPYRYTFKRVPSEM